MEISSLIPRPDIMPAHPLLFLVLGIVFFTIHIILVNIAFGGALILLYKSLRAENPGNVNVHDIGLSKKIPTVIALAINFGVAPYLFLYVLYGQFFYTSSVLMALFWFLIVPLLIIVYYGAYIQAHTIGNGSRISTAALAVMVILVLFIAFIFVNNMTMLMNPRVWTSYFKNSGGTVLNLGDPTLAPRYLHFIFASVAVGGLFMAVTGECKARRGAAVDNEKTAADLKIYSFATMAQVVVGIWFLVSLPGDFTGRFLGGSLFYTALLAIAVLAALLSIAVSLRGKTFFTLGCFLVTVVLMAITRSNVRSLYLEEYYSVQAQKIVPQYGPGLVFLIAAVAGVLVIRYMVKAALDSYRGEAGQ